MDPSKSPERVRHTVAERRRTPVMGREDSLSREFSATVMLTRSATDLSPPAKWPIESMFNGDPNATICTSVSAGERGNSPSLQNVPLCEEDGPIVPVMSEKYRENGDLCDCRSDSNSICYRSAAPSMARCSHGCFPGQMWPGGGGSATSGAPGTESAGERQSEVGTVSTSPRPRDGNVPLSSAHALSVDPSLQRERSVSRPQRAGSLEDTSLAMDLSYGSWGCSLRTPVSTVSPVDRAQYNSIQRAQRGAGTDTKATSPTPKVSASHSNYSLGLRSAGRVSRACPRAPHAKSFLGHHGDHSLSRSPLPREPSIDFRNLISDATQRECHSLFRGESDVSSDHALHGIMGNEAEMARAEDLVRRSMAPCRCDNESASGLANDGGSALGTPIVMRCESCDGLRWAKGTTFSDAPPLSPVIQPDPQPLCPPTSSGDPPLATGSSLKTGLRVRSQSGLNEGRSISGPKSRGATEQARAVSTQ
uniref:WGS project CAEQ00000000 data, annotated contig 2263 n=1 Tax=Trypanosoma congolense (strain IL3000) TaxID=1068625 RepID=F9WCT0_TRYCI|nr:unnamed protein product [Trypanosoma congolense IL3000]